MDNCYFCGRLMQPDWERIMFDPEAKPGQPLEWGRLKHCCMGCEGRLKQFYDKRGIEVEALLEVKPG